MHYADLAFNLFKVSWLIKFFEENCRDKRDFSFKNLHISIDSAL